MSTSSHSPSIIVKGCAVHNLKHIDVSIPRNRLTVITGVSGSGKSSLAFDTLYAEGQRRYVESLSSYARQFLGQMRKPDCVSIAHLPPAIAVEQRVVSKNPRSTVATSSGIYDYLRLLMARVGKLIDPRSGEVVKKETVADVVTYACSLPSESRIMVLVALNFDQYDALKQRLELLPGQGYTRLLWKQQPVRINQFLTDIPTWDKLQNEKLYLIVDRLKVEAQEDLFLSRLADSIETAFYEGNGACLLHILRADDHTIQMRSFSNRFEVDGREYQEPSPELFNFNSPAGACPTCEGFGSIVGVAPELVIPNPSLSVYEDCVACWVGPKSSLWKKEFMQMIRSVDPTFDIHAPYEELTPEQQQWLWKGAPQEASYPSKKLMYGIDDYFAMLQKEIHKIQNRVRLARFRGKTTCPDCHGGRLQPDALLVQYLGKNIAQIGQLSIQEAEEFFSQQPHTKEEQIIAKRLLHEIANRLHVLNLVGVGYLSLDRRSNTLSGGESQRINLATRLGNSLVGALYVLDEPSIGLHERDTDRLIEVLLQLRDQGNTVVVVEHDEHTMRAADYIIDIGPKAGIEGGEVVFAGTPEEIGAQTPGYTAAYLSGKEQIPLPAFRRPIHRRITIKNAKGNNLKGFQVDVPLHAFTVVTGVSGSGKSTLVHDLLFQELNLATDSSNAEQLVLPHLSGDISLVKEVVYVDQSNVGRSSRSNPATYIGAYNHIREFYSSLPLSMQMGYKPYYFSFNKEGGRCETCKGEGTVTIEMQFLTDLTVTCDECDGKRFNPAILEVEYQGKNISDILDLTTYQAIEFFNTVPAPYGPSIVQKLQALKQVGLGYLKLGQSSSTLSGGENQRLKLAKYLANESAHHTLFIFDEPTTGLHFHDIHTLLKAFNALIETKHTVLVIEHNMEVIKCADYIIDLGPEGGAQGGYLVAAGTPEEVAACSESITGTYLKEKLSTNTPKP